MVRNVAGEIAELEEEDFYLLSGVEQGMRFSEYVNREKLPEFARLTPEEVDYRLDRCERRGLVERKTIQYEGYRLTFEGYDALALHTFAERENDALETLYPTVSVPQPVDQNRHAIVMERIDGVELERSRLDPQQVLPVLELILDEMALAYEEGYVHADMSEYNVFVNSDGVTVFDWPQAVPTDHENSDELLRRDVENIVGYFERKYPGQADDVDVDGIAAAIRTGAFDAIDEFVE